MILTHLTSEANYTWLHYRNGQKHLTARTLKFYETTFPSFIRIHKNALVNPAFISRIEPPLTQNDLGLVVLRSGEELTISRRRWLKIAHQLLPYINERSS